MPYPMVHLAISIKLYELCGVERSPEFLLGGISPDSIHMRPNAGKTEKATTHLDLLPLNRLPADFDMLQHVQSFLEGHLAKADKEHVSFVKGYATHVLTDVFWLQTVQVEYKRDRPGELTKEEIRSIYSSECDQVDYALYQYSGWRPAVWDLLRQVKSRELRGVLAEVEICMWRDRVLGIYDTIGRQPPMVPKYITFERVLRFIEEAAHELIAQFKKMGVPLVE
ncbi:hypothetical protein [Paenibacillus koleovorans]|uniref:hypothetical protein n=1 Tax=Paenibacillus koleovorans TaxID=121608 RepID=UPI000FD8791E|nr:hypothetical protein [Paenibacillus koleovorans]